MKSAMQKLLFEIEFDNDSSPYKTRQNSDVYLRKFTAFRKSIIQNLQQYITVEVVPKEPPRYYSPIMTRGTNNLYHDLKHNKLVHFPRKDSFQIYIDNFLVFSKLQTGMWPSVSTITQWAFKVAEKMLDLQIQKETGSINDSRKGRPQQLESAAANYEKSNGREELNQDQILRPATLDQQKLPRINQVEGRGSITSNYTTLPAKAIPKEPHYEQNGNNNDGLPKGFSYVSRDMQKTQLMFKLNNKQQQRRRYKLNEEQQTVYYTDSKSRPKNQSFHWNIGTPRRLSLGKQTIRVNAQNPKQPIYRNKNIELSPLPAQVKAQRDKINSEMVKASEKTGNQIQKIDLRISQSILNANTNCYQIKGNKLIKKSKNNVWSPIVCQNLMPLKGQYYVSIAVLHSRQNNIQLGIAPLNYFPKQQISQNQQMFICYDCSNGKIKDSKLDEIASRTSWRLGGDSAPRQKSYQMRLSVDADTNYIDWYVEQTIVASSKISKPFQQGFRIFVSLQNFEDCILLNEQNWKDKQKQHKLNEDKYFLHQQQQNIERKGTIVHYQKHIKPLSHQQQQRQSKISHSNYQLDQCVQTQFVGRIKHQRVAKLIQKRKKIQDTIEHTAIKNVTHQNNENFKTSDSKQQEEQSTKSKTIKWKATYSQADGFEINQNEENQGSSTKINRRILVQAKPLSNQIIKPAEIVTITAIQKQQQLPANPTVTLKDPQKINNNKQANIKQQQSTIITENHKKLATSELPTITANQKQTKAENKNQFNQQPVSGQQIKQQNAILADQPNKQSKITTQQHKLHLNDKQQQLNNVQAIHLQAQQKEKPITKSDQPNQQLSIQQKQISNTLHIQKIQSKSKQPIHSKVEQHIHFPQHEHKWEAYYEENNYKIKEIKRL